MNKERFMEREKLVEEYKQEFKSIFEKKGYHEEEFYSGFFKFVEEEYKKYLEIESDGFGLISSLSCGIEDRNLFIMLIKSAIEYKNQCFLLEMMEN